MTLHAPPTPPGWLLAPRRSELFLRPVPDASSDAGAARRQAERPRWQQAAAGDDDGAGGDVSAAVGVVPRQRGGGAAAPAAAEAEAQDAAGPARRREGGQLPLRLPTAPRWRRGDGEEDAEQGAGERRGAAEHVAAARHGVGGVDRGRPGGGRRGALRQGRPAAAAAVRRPGRLRPPLLPVQLGEYVLPISDYLLLC